MTPCHARFAISSFYAHFVSFSFPFFNYHFSLKLFLICSYFSGDLSLTVLIKCILNIKKKCTYWQSYKEHSRLCSNHFSQESFTQNIEVLESIGWSLKRLTLKPDAVSFVFDFQVRSHKEKIEAAKRTVPDSHLIGAKGRGSKKTERKECSAFAMQRRKEMSCIWPLVYLKQNKI